MWKGLMPDNLLKRAACFVVLVLCASGLQALGISAVKAEDDGERTFAFCGKFEVENWDLRKTAAGIVLLPPEDFGGYKNIKVLSKDLSVLMKNCFEGTCIIVKACPVPLKTVFVKKVNEGKTILVDVIFGEELKAVFLVSQYKRKGKTHYRIKKPQDFVFKDKKLEASVRSALLKIAKENL